MWKLRNNALKSIEDIMSSNSGQEFSTLQVCNEIKIKGLFEAIQLISDNIYNPIWIINDYDGDGNCAGVITYLTCSQAGGNPVLRTPRRFSEGYGISHKIVDEILSKCDKPGLVIMVDNGITAIEQVKRLKEAGFSVMVLDHHKAKNEYPDADVLIDLTDGQHDETVLGFTPYCGAGIALKVMEAYNEYIGGISERALNTAKILAGFATVSDVVDIKNGNRKVVKECLDMVNGIISGKDIPVTAGLKAFIQQIGTSDFNEGIIGYKVGPMLNAPERLKDGGANIVFRAMLASTEKEAAKYISQLVVLNDMRKKKSRAETDFAMEEISLHGLHDKKIICLASSVFSEGLCGIIAGKITEKFHRPSIVFSLRKDKTLKGSGRSVDEVNLFALLEKLNEHFLGFGGHEKAAGIAMKQSDFFDFTNEANNLLSNVNYDMDTVYYDMDLNLSDISAMSEKIKPYAPFGEGNPKPVFRIRNFVISPKGSDFYSFMGDNKEHFKVRSSNDIEAMGFWMSDKAAELQYPKKIDMLATLSERTYLGNKIIQLEMIDFEKSKEHKTFKSELEKSLSERMSTFTLS